MSTKPHHLAIIMDDNRRCARQLVLSTVMAHKKGAAVLKDVAPHAHDQ